MTSDIGKTLPYSIISITEQFWLEGSSKCHLVHPTSCWKYSQVPSIIRWFTFYLARLSTSMATARLSKPPFSVLFITRGNSQQKNWVRWSICVFYMFLIVLVHVPSKNSVLPGHAHSSLVKMSLWRWELDTVPFENHCISIIFSKNKTKEH